MVAYRRKKATFSATSHGTILQVSSLQIMYYPFHLVRLNKRMVAVVLAIALCLWLSGCAVVTVTGAVVGATASVAGLAVDATVGTAKVAGKVITAPFD